jgi:iron complex outermembrane recepter protein
MLKSARVRSALIALVCSLSLSAQAWADGAKRAISIPSGDLGTALALLAKQAGADLVYRPEQVQGLKTRGVEGELSTEDAVKRLLEGTSLVLSVDSTGALLIALPPPAAQAKPTADAAPDSKKTLPMLEEITVTATRREENIRQVPISINAYSQAQLEERNITQIDDLSRFTPGLEFVHAGGVSGNSSNSISIRGIASDVGSATTALYIDDTPIQIRNIGYFASNPYPRVFDLERVEVLKGPQGTLFGASAEGGAVRFISPQPGLRVWSGQVRSEISTAENGDPSYEVGAAIGGPIKSDVLGFRFSAWMREDGGYIDRVDSATGATIDKDINSERSTVVRGALAWQPLDALTITPSVLYQHGDSHGRDQYWESLSDPGDAAFRTGNPLKEPSRDEFYLPALKAEFRSDTFAIVSNTSFFERDQRIFLDYTNFLQALFTGDPLFALPGTIQSGATVTTKQHNFSQEVRAQSISGKFVDWTIGVYYSHARQTQLNLTDSNFDGGTAANGYAYTDDIRATDEQAAGFANLDFHLANALKLSVGARVSRTKFKFVDKADGPINGGPSDASNATSETPVTPKVGLSYAPDGSNLLYTTASKGFRPGGAQALVPSTFCAGDLATLGLTSSPTTYGSDSLWSYEVGSKNLLLGGRLSLDANAYYSPWKNIQRAVSLPGCSFSFITNLGKATSRGVDLSVDALLSSAFRVGAAVGYNRTTFDEDVLGGGGVILAREDDRTGGPELTGTAWGQFEFRLPGEHKSYFRTDVTFRSKGPSRDPATFSYDPDLPALPSTTVVSLRLGTQIGALDAALFIENVGNAHEPLFRSHDIVGSPLFYAGTYRARTFGVDAAYRF